MEPGSGPGDSPRLDRGALDTPLGMVIENNADGNRVRATRSKALFLKQKNETSFCCFRVRFQRGGTMRGIFEAN